MSAPRHVRPTGRLADVRPLDPLRSIKIKLGVLVGATVTMSVLVTWIGLNWHLGPSRTMPLAIFVSLVLTQILARGMTSPLREMTAAARAMAGGDYTRRVQSTSRDEVGQLAEAFNTMAEDLGQADAVRRELIANVSHELRTPVAALRAQLENIVDGVTEPDPATMQAALSQTERLGRLVTYLLDLSRVEAGAVGLDLHSVDLAEFLGEATDEAGIIGAAKGVTFTVDVEPPGLTIVADSERLHQVVANLLHNAVRHSPPTMPVQLRARINNGRTEIDVIDQGPGIPADQRKRVFERFAKGAPPAMPGHLPTGGTGLGLAIVQWAVGLHSGTVEVLDTDTGCTIRVSLPVTGPPPGPAPSHLPSQVDGQSPSPTAANPEPPPD